MGCQGDLDGLGKRIGQENWVKNCAKNCAKELGKKHWQQLGQKTLAQAMYVSEKIRAKNLGKRLDEGQKNWAKKIG